MKKTPREITQWKSRIGAHFTGPTTTYRAVLQYAGESKFIVIERLGYDALDCSHWEHISCDNERFIKLLGEALVCLVEGDEHE